MVLYSSTKFGILKTWTNISWPRTFTFRFQNTSKQVYRQRQYQEKVSEAIQSLPRIPRKWFCIRQPNSAFSSLESIFHGPGDSIYDFCQIQTNLRQTSIYGERFWRVWSFTSLFQKKGFVFVDLIWHPKDLNQYSISQKIRCRVWQTSKQIHRKLQYKDKVFEEFQGLSRFPRKNGFAFVNQMMDSKVFNQF